MTRLALAALLVSVGGALGASCSVESIDLEGKRCPCSDGWECDFRGVCVKVGVDGGGTSGKDGGKGGSSGSGGSATGGSSGSGGSSSGGTGNVGTGGSSGCGGGEKLCDSVCVPTNAAHGCSSSSCDACANVTYPNASVGCPGGACGPSCNNGFGNCDGSDSTGCETPLNTIAACGQCNNACSTANGASAALPSCAQGQCTLACAAGFANCNPGNTPDDGCESSVASSTSSCGACGNSCSFISGQFVNWTCTGGHCGCTTPTSCRGSNNVQSASCNTSSGNCVCGATECSPGELCFKSGGSDFCRCNGTVKCTGTQRCCGNGCTDVQTDASNCGGCGRVCASGQTCSAGSCI